MADVTGPDPSVAAFAAAVATATPFLAGVRGLPTTAGPVELPRTLPEGPGPDVAAAVHHLARDLAPGIMPSPGPRYFGFVTGGTLPSALAAEVLVGAWDQNVALAAMSPALAEVESVTAEWVADLLGLPAGLSAGFVTGATMANWTALAAARHHLLTAAGWDLEADGMAGSPPITVVVGAERHSAIDLSLRYLGFGRSQLVVVPADDQGRMDAAALAHTMPTVAAPAIVCAQAGNVNSGSIDPMDTISDIARAAGAWLHVDAAVGAWLAASARLRPQLAGWERADSWALDAHKGLNTGYDSGIVLTAHPASHRAATQATAAYLPASADHRDGSAWTPEGSRRGRALGVYAVLRQLGRSGVADLVERQCDLAARFAEGLARIPGVTVANEVTANQVLVRFAGGDAVTHRVVALVQEGGVCWMGGTRWRDAACMRISVSNWMTTPADVDRAIDEVSRCWAEAHSR